MSHAGIISESTAAGADLKTLTGDIGAAVPGDGANNIDLIGTAAQGLTFTGTPASNQIQGTIADASTIAKGVALFSATDFNTAAGTVYLNVVAIGTGGTGQTTQTAGFNALSPLTTKGDVLTHNGTNNIRLAVGTDTYALVADSAQASGLNWAQFVGGSTGATDNAILRADGVGGYTIQNSLLTIDDNGMVNIPAAAYPNTISGISFGSGNQNSIREYWDNQLYFKIDNTDRFYMGTTFFQAASHGGRISSVTGVATPDLSFADDTNSGLYYIGADKFGFSAGGYLAANVEEVSNIAWVTFYNHLDFNGISSGYTGSTDVMRQAGVQTADGAATQIAAITVATNTMVTVNARFNGFKSDYSAAVGGYLQYTARRAGAGAVEVSAPNITIDTDSVGAPVVDADVSGNDVRLLVTGVALETWNWTVTYNYNFLATNA